MAYDIHFEPHIVKETEDDFVANNKTTEELDFISKYREDLKKLHDLGFPTRGFGSIDTIRAYNEGISRIDGRDEAASFGFEMAQRSNNLMAGRSC